ncbi:phage DNA ejection protein [Salmonella enterica subsp. enterica serovar Schwarzengrund]|nr:acyltransferase [Salmonella enterica subsp. enterica serovar Schwarzengrund]ELD9723071.1 phage DNA ejection protein [Salmonella enterica]EIR6364003.1 phage DNA ejection protein [Salmonella enterica subsp. enterica serovar Schwarzengrund]EJZ4273305.1 phage DNA ejection protein [Salmonella enterica subsp. enterica serovar Schwarzengrund]EKR9330472.1 phage DNA ejection protein [Salmonella enterica subsp. enterica serovar Schwarzengrund]
MQVANQNAPGQPSLSNYDFSQRPNVGVQLAQGIGAVGQAIQQNEAAQRLSDFQKAFGQAYAAGDRDALRQLAATNPDQIETIRQGMGFIDADKNQAMGDMSARLNIAAAQGPEAVMKELASHQSTLQQIGVSPEQAWQTYQQSPEGFAQLTDLIGMHAVGPEKYFDIQDKMAGREIDRGRLAETIRSNQAGEALQARGQNLSYQSAMTGHGLAAERLALDKQKFGFEVQQAQKKAEELINAAPKLSVNMEKAIEKSAGDAAASRNAADSMTTLADTLEKEKPTPGLFGNAENMFSKLTGQDNYLRDMRIRFNQLANAQATKLLPPGPASDKDIEFARKGIPSETDNPMVMARWLRGMAKMESNNAKFNEFKSEWMSANGSPGQSDRNRNIMGMDVKKGESLNSAAKRFLSSSYGDSQPQQQLSDDELISKYLGEQ